MTRIVHLSDLHFGLHRAALVEPLLALVNQQAADLVVITGDLTHRGRPGQFREAREFIDRITAPVMAVPGNHDVPLFNIPVRFLLPWAGYRQAISTDLAPTSGQGRVRVLGLNSVDPFAWQRGIVRKEDIPRIIGGLDPLAANVVALHHPLQQLPQVHKDLASNASTALGRFEAAGVRVVLSGHLHHWVAAALLDRGHPGILQIQAGTALCDRSTDRQNEFAVLDFKDETMSIDRHIAPADGIVFRSPERIELSRQSGVWQVVETA